MSSHLVLEKYIENALDQAEYARFEDGSHSGSIPVCPGVIAFANSPGDCERELRSVLEEWLLLGMKQGHVLPVIGGIDLYEDCALAEAIRQGQHTGFATREDVFRLLG